MRISDWSSDVCSSDLIRFLAITLAMFAGHAYADATLNFVDPASGAFQSRIAVADGKLRVDAAGAAGGSYVVLDLKTRTLTQINPSARTTNSSSIEQVQDRKSTTSALQSLMRTQYAV